MFLTKFFSQKKNSLATNVEILVLGNRGAGKTSLLATMLYNMNELLNEDGILFQPEEEETKKNLQSSITEMKSMFTSKGIVEVGEGISGTDGFVDYRFNLEFLRETGQSVSDFRLVFHDYAGSILMNKDSGKQYEKLKENFLKSKVVLILVDTPYLMESTSKVLSEYSAKEEILTLFQETEKKYDNKLVAIVPTKCEYYLRNLRISEVVDKLRVEFKELISCISQYNKNSVNEDYMLYVTPVQTMGGLEFCKMENKENGQVATFRRTKPNSQFSPQDTDLLLLFCINYLMNDMLSDAIEKISFKNKKEVMEMLIKLDGANVMELHKEQYNSLVKQKNEKELTILMCNAINAFFMENGKRESIIHSICENKDILTFYKIYLGKKSIMDKFGKRFNQCFTKLYV